MPNSNRLHWLAVCVLVSSSALNYLDRTLLSALMPTIRTEFALTGEDLGNLVASFSIVYGISSPLMGMLIDRIGLRWGAALIVAMWSLAGMATGLAGTFAGLLVCRSLLGFAEAGGIPTTGKGYALYLRPEDRAMGAGLGQVGITVGAMSAPLLAEWNLGNGGWRSAFVVAGALGFFWIPLWLWTSSRIPVPQRTQAEPPLSWKYVLRDKRFQTLIAANALAMAVYSLWTTWTTQFLVQQFGLSQGTANLRFAWIPPIFATIGGLCGGWLAHRLILLGQPVARARTTISVIASLFVFATAAAPFVETPEMAVAAISLSLFATTCLSVNYYAVPLDLFGSGPAAFSVSALTGVYGLMQALLSPQIGRWSDQVGWGPVCMLVAILPLVSALLLRAVLRTREV